MRTLVGLVFIGWLLQQPWLPFLVIGLILLAAGFLAWMAMQHWELQTEPQPWRRIEPHFEESQTEDRPPSDRELVLLDQIEQLETDLKDARQEVDTLRAANERLAGDLKNAKAAETRDCPNPLFRRVGLDEGAPEWVVVVVRRAYRKRLHPDVHPEHRKKEAERRFKQCEEVFDQIWRVRGFSP